MSGNAKWIVEACRSIHALPNSRSRGGSAARGTARVERRPVDRPATEADLAAFKEGTIEVRESAEEAVVAKKARVVEEVRVGKEVNDRSETITDTVRRTEVDVDKVGERQTHRQ